MAAKRSSDSAANGAPQGPQHQGGGDPGAIKPEQALALISMGLMQKLAANGELPWVWNESEDGGACDVGSLRQRLELTDLALRTGAPLSTAEVTFLLGARPGGEAVERGGLRAQRLSRNVWRLSQAKARGESGQDGGAVSFQGFNDGRRRFA